MAVIGTRTQFGYVISCTSGTAGITSIVPKGTGLEVIGVSVAGAAATDIVTIFDGDGNLFAYGVGPASSVGLADIARIDGLQASVAGATTGKAVVYLR